MTHVAGLRVYPVKALDGADRAEVGFAPGGALAGDREFALVGPAGEPINGKRTDRVHRLRTAYDPASGELAVEAVDGDRPPARFDLEANPAAAEDWFGAYFGVDVRLRRAGEQGFVDRPDAGPSVVSTATLEAVASWVDGLADEDVRRRLRANLEVGGVPAFWEDRFVGEGAPAIEVGPADGPGVRLVGIRPCGRCVVPTRDPATGEPTPGFRERFLERRRATFPDWADPDAFDHDYTLMLIAQVHGGDRDGTIAVGDPVRVVDAGT